MLLPQLTKGHCCTFHLSAYFHPATQEHAQAPDTEFKPNLVNTVCFLVQFIVMLVTFAVNYQARATALLLRHRS